MFKATIRVTLKESVLDPQGVAVKGSLHAMGFATVENVRIGKLLEVLLETDDRAEAEIQVQTMCEKLLSNPVVENFTFQLEEAS
jgi:phosphoribosylformylglycinamidine synthase PurS subunit